MRDSNSSGVFTMLCLSGVRHVLSPCPSPAVFRRRGTQETCKRVKHSVIAVRLPQFN